MAATLCGSPMYMAPEVLMSHVYDSSADLYSIGTIVYQCLTGRAPFHATSPQELRAFYERSDQLRPSIPAGTSPQLGELICSLLRKNPKERLQAADFFRHPFMRDNKPRKVRFLLFISILSLFNRSMLHHRQLFRRQRVEHLLRWTPPPIVVLHPS